MGRRLLQRQRNLRAVRGDAVLRCVRVGRVFRHGVAVGIEAGFDADSGGKGLAHHRVGGAEVDVEGGGWGGDPFDCGGGAGGRGGGGGGGGGDGGRGRGGG